MKNYRNAQDYNINYFNDETFADTYEMSTHGKNTRDNHSSKVWKISKIDVSFYISRLESLYTIHRGLIVKLQIMESSMARGQSIHGQSIRGQSIHGQSIHGQSIHGQSTHGQCAQSPQVLGNQSINQIDFAAELSRVHQDIFNLLTQIMDLMNDCPEKSFNIEERDISILLDILFDGSLDEFSYLLVINILVAFIRAQSKYNFSILFQKFLHFNFQSEAILMDPTHLQKRKESRVIRELNAFTLFNKLIETRKENFIPYLSVFWRISFDILEGLVKQNTTTPNILAHEVMQFVYNLVKMNVYNMNLQPTQNLGNTPFEGDIESKKDIHRSSLREGINVGNSSSLSAGVEHHLSRLGQSRIYAQSLQNEIFNQYFGMPNEQNHSDIALLENVITKSFCLEDTEAKILSFKICRYILKTSDKLSLTLKIFSSLQEFVFSKKLEEILGTYICKLFEESNSSATLIQAPFIHISENQILRTGWSLLIQSLYKLLRSAFPIPSLPHIFGSELVQYTEETRIHETIQEELCHFFSKLHNFICIVSSDVYTYMDLNLSSNLKRQNQIIFYHFFFQLFGSHDADLIQVLLYLLRIYTILYDQQDKNSPNITNLPFIKSKEAECAIQEEWKSFLLPNRFFFQLMEYIGFRINILYDFLTSSETPFLEYLLLFCKWRNDKEKSNTHLENEVDGRIHQMLCSLRHMILCGLQNQDFPFNPQALLKHLPEK